MRSRDDLLPPPRKGEPFTEYLERVTAIRRPYKPEEKVANDQDTKAGALRERPDQARDPGGVRRGVPDRH